MTFQIICISWSLFSLLLPNWSIRNKIQQSLAEYKFSQNTAEKLIDSIHGNFTFTCIHTLRLQKRGFLYETGFLPGHTLFGFWVFFCFLPESVDCERKSLDFEGRTWNGGKCGAIHTKAYLGSITSRCSGNEPALLLLLGPVARSLVSPNRWLRGIKMYRFPWYLTLVSANHASSNPSLGRTERAAEIEPGWCRQQTNTLPRRPRGG